MSEEKCPYVATGGDGTQFCRLAEHAGCVLNEWRARAEKAEVSEMDAVLRLEDNIKIHIQQMAELRERGWKRLEVRHNKPPPITRQGGE